MGAAGNPRQGKTTNAHTNVNSDPDGYTNAEFDSDTDAYANVKYYAKADIYTIDDA